MPANGRAGGASAAPLGARAKVFPRLLRARTLACETFRDTIGAGNIVRPTRRDRGISR